MNIKIGGKFIHNGTFKAECPKCKKIVEQNNKGEIKEIKCECGYAFLTTNSSRE